eukprot:CAMPEP_0170065062 /NCGR_PEP_ID=MMETSP0019_2-20121128/5295_1 /TAXON_ID=98059 /ORGANISM="Dinobryon sp., Strain UTEXLB2267" /LENGTH=292 /DNA_ID=CAMNT_0010271847 /DNA_START=376 /DNA_END=1254 /DNA_ORIENTATION=+
MIQKNPVWVDVTWGAGGSTADSTFTICEDIVKKFGADVMMHLTCTNMEVSIINEVLEKCKKAGIRNILALRGDPPAGQEWKKIEGGFANAVDLVKYIRKLYGDYFCIGVAGYPEGHVDCNGDLVLDMEHLKAKVDAGADLIVTQLFYSTDLFVDYVKRCRAAGVKVPIFPGIMPIQSYAGFKRMTELCKTYVPPSLLDALEPIKDDADKVKAFGVELSKTMCEAIRAQCGPQAMGADGVFGLHFYTLNSDVAVMQILQRLGMIDAEDEEKEAEQLSPADVSAPPVTVFTAIA